MIKNDQKSQFWYLEKSCPEPRDIERFGFTNLLVIIHLKFDDIWIEVLQ